MPVEAIAQDDITLAEIDAAFDCYESEVRAAGLRPRAEETYLLQSSQVVRWMHNDFTPALNSPPGARSPALAALQSGEGSPF